MRFTWLHVVVAFMTIIHSVAGHQSLYSPAVAVTDPRIERIVKEVSAARIKASIATLVAFGTRHTLSDTIDPHRGIGAARRWIKSEFERAATASGGRMTADFDEFVVAPSPRIPRPTTVVNVVATLHPHDLNQPSAKRFIVITGHYDSRVSDVMDATSPAPGADDDGSGTAVVLELARVLSREDLRATVVFICFAGEEQGLFGSKHAALMAEQRGEKFESVLNNDIVGGVFGGNGEVDSSSVRVFSEAFSPLDTGVAFQQRNSLGFENDGASRSLARYAKEIGERYVPGFTVRLIYRGDRFLRGGDHIPFHQRGIAAVRFSESKEDFERQHQNIRVESGRNYGDLPQFVNPEYCAKVARVNAAVAASLGFAPSRPGGARLVTNALSYDTRLFWNRNNEQGVAGYFVRWRETTSPVWTHGTFTTDTTLTLKVSKDDCLFGIQAVSTENDASLYAFPTPIR